MASPAHLSHTPTLPHPSHAHAKKNPAASAGLAACGRCPVVPGARKLMVAKIGDAADTGECCAAICNGWGRDPHLTQRALLTVVSVGAAFGLQVEHGGGRIRRWRAPQITGELALLRPTPALAAAPLSHTRTHPQHLSQLPTPTPTHAC